MTLSAAEIAAMRDTADDYLPDTCVIQRYTSAQTAQGGTTKTWSTFASSVACRMDEPKTGAPEAAIAQAVGTAVKRIMHFKYDQDVTVKDRVIYSGKTYEVQEVLEAASWLITRRLIVTRVE